MPLSPIGEGVVVGVGVGGEREREKGGVKTGVYQRWYVVILDLRKNIYHYFLWNAALITVQVQGRSTQ